MKRILLIAIFVTGFILGFFLIYDSPKITGQAVVCSFENQDCICNNINCTCGDIVIPKELCYDELTLMELHSTT